VIITVFCNSSHRLLGFLDPTMLAFFLEFSSGITHALIGTICCAKGYQLGRISGLSSVFSRIFSKI